MDKVHKIDDNSSDIPLSEPYRMVSLSAHLAPTWTFCSGSSWKKRSEFCRTLPVPRVHVFRERLRGSIYQLTKNPHHLHDQRRRFANHGCSLHTDANAAFLLQSVLATQRRLIAVQVKQTNDCLRHASKINFVYIFPSASVSCVLSSCQEWNMLLETFLQTWKLFSCLNMLIGTLPSGLGHFL